MRVLRRVTFALNAIALSDGAVPAEGVFDAAVANGLAAIVADACPGAELGANGFVRPPGELLEVAATHRSWIDQPALSEAIALTQPVRHGRADDEWTRIGPRHVEALLDLDSDMALNVIESARGRTFEALVVELFAEEAESVMPLDPKERILWGEPEECDECGRRTVVGVPGGMLGIGLAVGSECVACGAVVDEDEVDRREIQFLVDHDST